MNEDIPNVPPHLLAHPRKVVFPREMGALYLQTHLASERLPVLSSLERNGILPTRLLGLFLHGGQVLLVIRGQFRPRIQEAGGTVPDWQECVAQYRLERRVIPARWELVKRVESPRETDGTLAPFTLRLDNADPPSAPVSAGAAAA